MMTQVQFDGYTTQLAERAVVALERIATCMERGLVYEPESDEERTVREAQEAFDEMMASEPVSRCPECGSAALSMTATADYPCSHVNYSCLGCNHKWSYTRNRATGHMELDEGE